VPLDPITELADLVGALERDAVGYAVCGGLALAVHGHVRATDDIDLLVPADQVAAAMRAARTVGFDVPGPRLKFGLRTGNPREVQRISKLDPDTGELLILDLLIVSPDLEAVWSGRVRLPWLDQPLYVVSRDGLATMKRIAGRPQDLADLAKLEGRDDEQEQ
jgi:hypothetical protein